MLVEKVPVAFGLLCALGLCGNSSTDIRCQRGPRYVDIPDDVNVNVLSFVQTLSILLLKVKSRNY